LRNGQNVLQPEYCPAFIDCETSGNTRGDKKSPRLLKPFIFFDLASSMDQVGASSQSRSNPEEARLCVAILRLLMLQAAARNQKVGSIGVITPYQDQLNLLRKEVYCSIT